MVTGQSHESYENYPFGADPSSAGEDGPADGGAGVAEHRLGQVRHGQRAGGGESEDARGDHVGAAAPAGRRLAAENYDGGLVSW